MAGQHVLRYHLLQVPWAGVGKETAEVMIDYLCTPSRTEGRKNKQK